MEYLQYYLNIGSYENIAERFKPCYKWNTFNTNFYIDGNNYVDRVLNLVISGIPSILNI